MSKRRGLNDSRVEFPEIALPGNGMTKLFEFFFRHRFFYSFLFIILGLFYCCMIKNLYPFIHSSESVYVTADAMFLVNNVNFFPIPHLVLPCDYFAYPYKFNPVFLTWMLEHDFLAGFFYSVIGIGPWEQLYWLFSLFLSATVCYHLLSFYGRFETWRSIAFALLVTFCNYAVICKYPDHYTLVIYHWVAVSLVMDFLILKKYFDKESFSATFVLLKILFLLLTLGLELGYIAGMAFCSFFLVCLYLFVIEWIRTGSLLSSFRWFANHFLYVVKDYPAPRNYLLTFLIVFAAWLYLPIILQIIFVSKNGTISSSPLMETAHFRRILFPIFPGFNPVMFWKHCSVDPVYGAADTIYAYCVGWSTLLLFIFGIVFSRKRILITIPFILLTFLILFVVQIPLLKYFPCFTYARFNERFSAALVPLMLMPFLGIGSDAFKRNAARFFILLLVPLFYIECFTAYHSTFIWIQSAPVTKQSTEFYQIIKRLQKAPGQALFSFPFSVCGGDNNGAVASHDSYPVPHIMQFSALAKKKTNAYYGGRFDISSGEMKNLAKKNWDGLFRNAKKGMISEFNIKLLDDFLHSADFSAVVLLANYLHPMFQKQMFAKYGPPLTFQYSYLTFHVILLPDEFRKQKFTDKEFQFCQDLVPSPENQIIPFSSSSGTFALTDGIAGDYWSVKEKALVHLGYPAGRGNYILTLRMNTFLCAEFPRRKVEIWTGKRLLFQQNISKPDNRIQLAVSPDMSFHGGLPLQFKVSASKSPKEAGLSPDPRKLGILFLSYSFSPNPCPKRPEPDRIQ